MVLSRRKFVKVGTTSLIASTLLNKIEAIQLKDNPKKPIAVETDLCRIVFDLDPVGNEKALEWIDKGGYTWGIEVPFNLPEEILRSLYDKGYEVILHLYAHPDTRLRNQIYQKKEVANVKEVLERHISAAGGDRSKVIWQILCEDDSAGVGHSQNLLSKKPRTHAEAYEMMEEYLRRTIAETLPYGNIHRWSMPGFAQTTHQFAKQKEIEMISIERANDDVDDLQTGIAFSRGAARQYKKMWGVDLSLWWGVIYGCINNLPSLYHKRHLYVSWFSGAQHFRIEGGDLFWDKANDRLENIGQCMDEFAGFIKKHERGTVETPVAVILPPDHGWITPPYWRTNNTAWNYAHIPYRQGQKALDGFFGTAFPGSNFYMDPFPFGTYKSNNPPASPFALSYIAPEFAPSKDDIYSAEPPIPFGRYNSRHEARDLMRVKQIETSDYRPMGCSKWGDIIDVFTTGVTNDILNGYKVIILLDQIELSADMIAAIKSSMQTGTTVIAAAGVIRPEHESLIGAEIIPELRVGQAWEFTGEMRVNEPFRYLPVTVRDATVLAKASNGAPLVLEKNYGKGKFITCLIPYFEGYYSSISKVANELFNRVVSEVQPVNVEGIPVEFLSTKSKDHYNVILSNNNDQEWYGKIILKTLDIKFKTCHELLMEKKISFEKTKSGGAEATVLVPPYEVCIFSWSE
jgi:hypothetical protein